VVGATYPDHARRARELMPNSIILVPGYGAQGAGARDAVVAMRRDGLGVIVNASRSLMCAWRKSGGTAPGVAAAEAASAMRTELNGAVAAALPS
jgi:orotidine-5'-phosphate decarboxylase